MHSDAAPGDAVPPRVDRPAWRAVCRQRAQAAAEAEAASADRGPITYGDPNQGEGHVVHIAHVGSARLGLEWARDLGVID